MVILDNSDWHPRTCALLRDSDLLQVDFAGAGPINSYAWCTSMFLRRDFAIDRIRPNESLDVIGGLKDISSEDRPISPVAENL